MAKAKTAYVCSECGASSSKWQGQCGECGAWNSMSEFVVEPASAAKAGPPLPANQRAHFDMLRQRYLAMIEGQLPSSRVATVNVN